MLHDKKLDDVMKWAMAVFFVLLGAGIFLKIGGFV
jgi:hypothetical protein